MKDLDLRVESGQVYGFLGPNGAGKSTTIRMIVDLVHPTQGIAILFGQSVRKHREVLKRVSAMVETPSFYGFLSGRDILEVLSRSANDFNPSRIDEVLDRADLVESADRRVKEYSTGMKQRLGVAGHPPAPPLAGFTAEPALVVSLIALGLWVVVPVALSIILFSRQDITS